MIHHRQRAVQLVPLKKNPRVEGPKADVARAIAPGRFENLVQHRLRGARFGQPQMELGQQDGVVPTDGSGGLIPILSGAQIIQGLTIQTTSDLHPGALHERTWIGREFGARTFNVLLGPRQPLLPGGFVSGFVLCGGLGDAGLGCEDHQAERIEAILGAPNA